MLRDIITWRFFKRNNFLPASTGRAGPASRTYWSPEALFFQAIGMAVNPASRTRNARLAARPNSRAADKRKMRSLIAGLRRPTRPVDAKAGDRDKIEQEALIGLATAPIVESLPRGRVASFALLVRRLELFGTSSARRVEWPVSLFFSPCLYSLASWRLHFLARRFGGLARPAGSCHSSLL